MLSCAELVIRNRESAITDVSSFFLTHEYHVDLIDFSLTKNSRDTFVDAQFLVLRAEVMLSKLKRVAELAQSIMTTAQQLQKEYVNARRDSMNNYEVNDEV